MPYTIFHPVPSLGFERARLQPRGHGLPATPALAAEGTARGLIGPSGRTTMRSNGAAEAAPLQIMPDSRQPPPLSPLGFLAFSGLFSGTPGKTGEGGAQLTRQ